MKKKKKSKRVIQYTKNNADERADGYLCLSPLPPSPTTSEKTNKEEKKKHKTMSTYELFPPEKARHNIFPPSLARCASVAFLVILPLGGVRCTREGDAALGTDGAHQLVNRRAHDVLGVRAEDAKGGRREWQ